MPPLHGSRWVARLLAHAAPFLLVASPVLIEAQVPLLLNYQGRLVLAGTNFDGTAQFKFALVDGAGTTSFWSHDGSSTGGAAPTSALSLPVTRGLYSILLGDTNIANMTVPVAATVFTTNDVRLRVWFSDGVTAFRLLTPDQRVASVGYALVAATSVGPVSESQLPTGVVTGAQAASAATSANTAGTLVRRDANGNFSAGEMTGTFTGNGSGLTNLAAAALRTSAPAGSVVVSTLTADATLLAANYLKFMSTAAPAWVNASTVNAPSARSGHSAVWTGQQMIVWGGTIGNSLSTATGASYNPTEDAWAATSSIGVPAARSGHSAVWTGTHMIVWGGSGNGESSHLATGGKFRTDTQIWSSVTTTGAPEARSDHVAIWTGTQMVVWGGRSASGLLNDGARYDPGLNQWTALSIADPPEARTETIAVWAGDRIIVWGGLGASGPLASGAQLLFAGGVPTQWLPITSTGAPAARSGHTAVWTGDTLIIWGGLGSSGPLADGAMFRPSTGAWTAITTADATIARYDHNAVWTGSEMVVAAGTGAAGELASAAALDPVAQQWRALSSLGNPAARAQSAAIWSGTELILFGGRSGSSLVGSPQRISPQPVWHFYRKL